MVYHRSGFECVVKRLRMVLDCDSNDCELLSGQATPSTVAKGVLVVRLHGVV